MYLHLNVKLSRLPRCLSRVFAGIWINYTNVCHTNIIESLLWFWNKKYTCYIQNIREIKY